MVPSRTLQCATILLLLAPVGCATDPGGGQGDPVAYVLGVDAADNRVVVRVSGPRLLVTGTLGAREDSQVHLGMALDTVTGHLYWIHADELALTHWTIVELTDALVEARTASSTTLLGSARLSPYGPLVPLPECGLLTMNFTAPYDTGRQRQGLLVLNLASLSLAGRVDGFYLLGRRGASRCQLLGRRVETTSDPAGAQRWLHTIDADALALGDSFPIPSNAYFVGSGPQPSSVYLSVGDRLVLFDAASQQALASTGLGFRGLLGFPGPFAHDAHRDRVIVGDPGSYETGGSDTVLVLRAADLSRLSAFGVLRLVGPYKTIRQVALASRTGEILVLVRPPPFEIGGPGQVLLLRSGSSMPVAASPEIPMGFNLIVR